MLLTKQAASKAHLGSLARAFAESMDKDKCSGLGVMVVCSLLPLSERLPCHIWLVVADRMKFASLEANLGGWVGPFSRILFSLPLSGRNPNITEIVLTGT